MVNVQGYRTIPKHTRKIIVTDENLKDIDMENGGVVWCKCSSYCQFDDLSTGVI
jgi:hypothetical protein